MITRSALGRQPGCRTALVMPIVTMLAALFGASCGGKADVPGGGNLPDGSADATADAGPDSPAGQDSALDGPVDYATCFGEDGNSPQWAITLCGGACEVVEHQKDCCGTIILIGISPGERSLFDACEAAWRANLPGCGCMQGPTEVQNPPGTTVDSTDQAVANCVNWTSSGGICETSKQP